jgi:hypothetical protein
MTLQLQLQIERDVCESATWRRWSGAYTVASRSGVSHFLSMVETVNMEVLPTRRRVVRCRKCPNSCSK